MQVYRKKWVIHIERITREKVNGACVSPPVGICTVAGQGCAGARGVLTSMCAHGSTSLRACCALPQAPR